MIPQTYELRKLSIPWGGERRRATARHGVWFKARRGRVEARFAARHPMPPPEITHQRAGVAAAGPLKTINRVRCSNVTPAEQETLWSLELILRDGVMSPMLDVVTALAAIQAHILRVRQMAAETSDPVRQAGCLRIADAIEQRARKEDQDRIAAALIDS